MKNLKISVLAIAFLIGMTSCHREGIIRDNFSNEEAAELVSNAIQNATDGISEQLSDMTQYVTETIADNFECGVTIDSSFTKTVQKVRVSAEYDVAWDWTPTCNDLDNMIALDYNGVLTGGYTGLRASSEETKTTSLTITGMQLASAVLTYDGSSLNEGTQTVTVKETKNISSKLTMSMTGITVDKIETEISDGDISFELLVVVDGGDPITFTGTVEFLGSRDANITINGETFLVDL